MASSRTIVGLPIAKIGRVGCFAPRQFILIWDLLMPRAQCKDAALRTAKLWTAAFGATEIMRMPMPGGRIGHAEIKIGDSHIMLADESPEQGIYRSQNSEPDAGL